MSNERARLLTHLRKYVGNAKINDDTRIYHDLDVAGDDAFEFIDEISADFKLDFSKMRFAKYFPNETEILPPFLDKIIGFRSRRKPLTFGHLLRVVEAGHWHEENG